MSDIKAGDLTIIYKPMTCCGYSGSIGDFIVVDAVVDINSGCSRCGKNIDALSALYLEDGKLSAIEISRLKKIPPLSDLEDVETHSKDLIPNKKETIGEMA
jgi:hypothetical protein